MLKEKTITINDNGNNLTFKIRQLTATKQEELIIKALLLLANKEVGDVDVDKIRENPQGFVNLKMLFGALEKVDFLKIKEIADELLGCCYRVVGKVEERCTPETVDGYVEDFRTLLTLKKEAFTLSFDFFEEGGNSQGTASKPTISVGNASRT